jgi:hypothetical protein
MKPGDRMGFTLMRDGTVIMRVKRQSVMKLAGVLHKKGRKSVSIEQLSIRCSRPITNVLMRFYG